MHGGLMVAHVVQTTKTNGWTNSKVACVAHSFWMFSPYSSAGGTGLSRRVSLAGAVDSDELRKCISERSGTKPKMQDLPVSGEDDDDSVLTEEKTNITCPVGTPGNAAVSAMIKV
uniref:Uncharacterized protein n=1 Tax=Meloidogyne hapla TaxID=6305 RepID=A0A1I8BMX0_MELHA